MNKIRCFVTCIISFILICGICSSSPSHLHSEDNKKHIVINQVDRYNAHGVLYCITAQWYEASEIIDTMDDSTIACLLVIGKILDNYFKSVKPHDLYKQMAQDNNKLSTWPLSMSESLELAKDSAIIMASRTRQIGVSLISFYADILIKHVAGISVPKDDKRLALAIECRFVNANFPKIPRDWTGIEYQVQTKDDVTTIEMPSTIRPWINSN